MLSIWIAFSDIINLFQSGILITNKPALKYLCVLGFKLESCLSKKRSALVLIVSGMAAIILLLSSRLKR